MLIMNPMMNGLCFSQRKKCCYPFDADTQLARWPLKIRIVMLVIIYGRQSLVIGAICIEECHLEGVGVRVGVVSRK